MFKFLRERKKDNKGFTLVELVIVVAILAILVGLLAPQYTKYVEKSRKSADASNMDEMVKAVQVYAADGEKTVPAIPAPGQTIELKEKEKPAVGKDLVNALKEYCPEYVNMTLKSAKWGTNPTATITITAEGAVTVTYSPKAFADFVGGEETKTAGGTGANAGTQETGE